ncbi:hypothetical protein LZ187_16705, partial [Rhodovulum sulfidophilum]
EGPASAGPCRFRGAHPEKECGIPILDQPGVAALLRDKRRSPLTLAFSCESFDLGGAECVEAVHE